MTENKTKNKLERFLESIETEKIRTKFYSDVYRTNLLYTSDWRNLSDIGTSGNWFGFIRTDFHGENLNKYLTY